MHASCVCPDTLLGPRARARSHSGARTQACSVTHPPRPTPGALEVLVKPTLVASARRCFLSHQELSDAFSKEFVAKMDEVTGKKGGKDRGWHEKGCIKIYRSHLFMRQAYALVRRDGCMTCAQFNYNYRKLMQSRLVQAIEAAGFHVDSPWWK